MREYSLLFLSFKNSLYFFIAAYYVRMLLIVLNIRYLLCGLLIIELIKISIRSLYVVSFEFSKLNRITSHHFESLRVIRIIVQIIINQEVVRYIMAQQCQLWMGSLQPYMTENFILAAFRKMGKKTENKQKPLARWPVHIA